MTIKTVETLDPRYLTEGVVHATLRTDESGNRVVFIARDDYYERGGMCYSGIDLTREDLEQLLVLLTGHD